VCSAPAPVVNAGSDASANEGAVVNLSGSVSGRGATGTLTYAWSRVSGPTVTINNGSTLTPNFTAPQVSANTPLVLRLTVSNGAAASSDDVTVTIVNTGGGTSIGGGGGGSFGGDALVLAGLCALMRRRRAR
jgi:hypothetical protein